ncbi:unnamed protein product, partial [marine sediment metagenome]
GMRYQIDKKAEWLSELTCFFLFAIQLDYTFLTLAGGEYEIWLKILA